MKILVDTNVILDIALKREPFVKQAAQLFKTAREQNLHLFLTATTVTDIYYIVRKEKGKETASAFLGELLRFVDVASVDKQIVIQALNSEMPDFEDAIQAYASNNEGIKTIVTRNEKDFALSELEVKNPESFLLSLQQLEPEPTLSERERG